MNKLRQNIDNFYNHNRLREYTTRVFNTLLEFGNIYASNIHIGTVGWVGVLNCILLNNKMIL